MLRRVFVERMYQNALQRKYKYGHKYLKCGITDITTPDKHIEIKKWPNWKESLGQLLAYNYYDPKLTLEAHFFGEYPAYKKEIAHEVFTKFDIVVVDLECTQDHMNSSASDSSI